MRVPTTIRSSCIADCFSRSRTSCSALRPTPRTCCRSRGCAGRRSISARCASRARYLVRIVTRQALNHLRTVARRREDYVGEWLPEPLLTSPDVADDVELAESLSIAMLTVLETLGPTERAVFVLREVFDVPYDEIADAVGKTPAAVRQIAHRAKDARRRATPPGARGALRARGGAWSGSSRRSTPATCRASWTSSRPTSSRSPTAAARCAARRGGRSSGGEAGGLPGRRPGEVQGEPVATPTWVNGEPGIRMELDGSWSAWSASPSRTAGSRASTRSRTPTS